MTCEEAQQLILAADNLKEFSKFTPELRAHLGTCAACQEMVAELVRIEGAAAALPLPAEAREPSAEFMRRVEMVSAGRRPFAQVWVRRAIAAAVVVAVGLAAVSVLTDAKPARADEIFKQLVDWNLTISSSHDAADRSRIYAEKAQQFQKEVERAHLAPEDLAVAEHLLTNAMALTAAEDPSAESKSFSEIAEELLARQKAPANAPIAQQIEQIRMDIVTHAIHPPVTPSPSPPQQPSSQEKPGANLIPRNPAMYQPVPQFSPVRSAGGSGTYLGRAARVPYFVSSGGVQNYFSRPATVVLAPLVVTKGMSGSVSALKADLNGANVGSQNAAVNAGNDGSPQVTASGKTAANASDLATSSPITGPTSHSGKSAGASDTSTQAILATLTDMTKGSSNVGDVGKFIADVTKAASEPDGDDAPAPLRSLNQGHLSGGKVAGRDDDGDGDDIVLVPPRVLREIPDLTLPGGVAALDAALPVLQRIVPTHAGSGGGAGSAVVPSVVVPEPGALGLLVGGLGMGMMVRRRRVS